MKLGIIICGCLIGCNSVPDSDPIHLRLASARIDSGNQPLPECVAACANMTALWCSSVSSDCPADLSDLERKSGKGVVSTDGSNFQCACVQKVKTQAGVQGCGISCNSLMKSRLAAEIPSDGGLPPCRVTFCGINADSGLCACFESNGESHCQQSLDDCRIERAETLRAH